jgi:excisionase family DNA binding protein
MPPRPENQMAWGAGAKSRFFQSRSAALPKSQPPTNKLHTDGDSCEDQTCGIISMKKADFSPEIMTVASVADYLQLHVTTIYWLLKNGQIPTLKLGADWGFSKIKIDQKLGISEIFLTRRNPRIILEPHRVGRRPQHSTALFQLRTQWLPLSTLRHRTIATLAEHLKTCVVLAGSPKRTRLPENGGSPLFL